MAAGASHRLQLRRAIRELRDRGLYTAAKWAAEQLVGLPEDRENVGPAPVPDEEDGGDGDVFLLAKAFFDMREYRRAAHALRGATGKKSFFLRCYATYLAGEKRKEEEIIELGGPLGRSDAVNPELAGLEQELTSHSEKGTLDAFGNYLYGVVLHERDRKSEARAVLCASVNTYPWNWSAWLELQALCTDPEILPTLRLEDHWMRDFFIASVYLDLQKNSEGLACYRSLHAMFPVSDYVLAQTATAHYNLREFDEAEGLFEELLRTDPYRIEGMDMYSNILYVKECFAALSHLAHKAVLTDKYRPETCCIIGNYYSLKAQHEKAVLYFKRALKLNRKYLSAWTLMGHEYVEMKNTPAAIDAYRRAVDINPRDYRAWYGLGQTYELLIMPFYALYYYRRAAQLRPHDARMWCAMGQCYENEQLQMFDAAIRCYRRAVNNNDREGIALNKLAKLHSQLGQADQASYYYKKNLERLEADQSEGQDVVDALLFLATHSKNQGFLDDSEMYCMRLLDYGGPAKEEAKALLREIRSVQQHASVLPSMDLEQFTP
ncbi:hypothetical protein SELMODRAFT_268860 [Selaginella moellendorffii]|uniref:Uncharacterized protein CDC23-2 n=1 Tax=Selaginella moellendorffii TaxID=88036 RepID=D8SLZ4_SELML|nr:anaphase-promoting complex subunit 8 [Selaginella moellendorffii]EFJ14516.1 hypothetical protein SELMODRAFT_268860 [Selaginella moellendorffii]|eukprot:XP_002984466.1 anaphase-promoting complex subunit 8 [Selaginella moellendorffii]